MAFLNQYKNLLGLLTMKNLNEDLEVEESFTVDFHTYSQNSQDFFE